MEETDRDILDVYQRLNRANNPLKPRSPVRGGSSFIINSVQYDQSIAGAGFQSAANIRAVTYPPWYYNNQSSNRRRIHDFMGSPAGVNIF